MKEDRETILARARSLQAAQREMMESLVDLREQHGLSQADIAGRMGVSQSAVAQFERYDSNPTLASIRRYALAVEARLDLKVTSDRAHDLVSRVSTRVRVMRAEAPTSAAIDWNSRSVTNA